MCTTVNNVYKPLYYFKKSYVSMPLMLDHIVHCQEMTRIYVECSLWALLTALF